MSVIRSGFIRFANFLRAAPESTVKKLVFYNITLSVFSMSIVPALVLMVPVPFVSAVVGLGLERRATDARGDRFFSIRTALSFPASVLELIILQILAATALSFFILIMFSLNRLASIAILAAVYALVRKWLFTIPALRRELVGIAFSDLASAAIITAVLCLIDVWAHFQYLLLINLNIMTAIFSLRLINSDIRSSIAGRKNHKERIVLWVYMLVLFLTILHGTRHLSALGCIMDIPGESRFELNFSPRAGINMDGFRGPDISLEKPAGTIRIAIMGDSATYGFLVSEEQTFSRILETLLQQNSRGMKYQVINGGVPSYTVVDSMARLKDKILKYDPDIVILTTGPNDSIAMKRGILSHKLQDFSEQIKKPEIKLVICTYPTIWFSGDATNEIAKQTREFAQSRNLPFIDLDLFMRRKYLYGTPDRHPNVRGHRVIADFLFHELVDAGVVESPSLERSTDNRPVY